MPATNTIDQALERLRYEAQVLKNEPDGFLLRPYRMGLMDGLNRAIRTLEAGRGTANTEGLPNGGDQARATVHHQARQTDQTNVVSPTPQGKGD